MSDQTIEITPFNVAYNYVYYCKQNEIKVNEPKINIFIERMLQPLISNQLEEEFRNIIFAQAITYSKTVFENTKC